MPALKATRKCDLCKREKDKSEFYSPKDRVCIVCNPDWRFMKILRRTAREGGVGALEDRIREYTRKINMTRAVLRSARRGEIT